MKPVGSLTSRELPTGQDGQRRLHDPRTSMLKKNRVTSPLYEDWPGLPAKFRQPATRVGELAGQRFDVLGGLVGGRFALAGLSLALFGLASALLPRLVPARAALGITVLGVGGLG